MDYFLKRQVSTAVRYSVRTAAPDFGRIAVYMLLYLSMVFLCTNIEHAEAKTTTGQTKAKPPAAVTPSAVTPSAGSPSDGPLSGMTYPWETSAGMTPPPGMTPAEGLSASMVFPPGVSPSQTPYAGMPPELREKLGVPEKVFSKDVLPPAAADSAGVLHPPAKPDNSTEDKLGKYDLIIEKNLFSPDRKKWITEPPGKPDAQMAKKELNDLVLLGTIISSRGRYAVLRTKKETAPQNGLQPYTKGDYVQGYLVKEIDEKKVLLLDESANLEYVVFINNENKVRLAEKTEVKPEQPKPASEPKKPEGVEKKKMLKNQPKNPASPSDTPEAIRQTPGKRNQRGGRLGKTPPIEVPENTRQAVEQNEEQ